MYQPIARRVYLVVLAIFDAENHLQPQPDLTKNTSPSLHSGLNNGVEATYAHGKTSILVFLAAWASFLSKVANGKSNLTASSR